MALAARQLNAAPRSFASPERAGEVIGQLVSQLAPAHRHGLCHRKVMPENASWLVIIVILGAVVALLSYV